MCPPLFPQTSLTFMYINVSAGHVVSQRHNRTCFRSGNDPDTLSRNRRKLLQIQLLTGSSHIQYFYFTLLFRRLDKKKMLP